MNYPQYQSHKKVSAVKIAKVDPGADGSLTLHLEGGFDNVVVPHNDVLRKPRPSEGWYLVVYEGGYISFSPAKAFEDGHTLVEQDAQGAVTLPPKPADVIEPAADRISGSPQHLVDERKARDAADAAKAESAAKADEEDDEDEDEDDPEVQDAANNHGQAEQPGEADEAQPEHDKVAV